MENTVSFLNKKRTNKNNKKIKKEKINIIINESINLNNFITAQEKLKELSKDKENLEKLTKMINANTYYDRIKYKDKIFYIGDILLVQAENEQLIGELYKILPRNGNSLYPFWPTIQIKWYYKKSDIDRKKNNLINDKNFNCISNYELFKTNHIDTIFIESIINKIELYTYEEYDKLINPNELSYFSRAKYDHNKKILIPKFDSWEKYCICKTPLNPDLLYIICDKCNKPFHPECCGISNEDCCKLDNFICPFCIKN